MSHNEIEIKFHSKENEYYLMVRDNGNGFIIEQTPNLNSVGLTLVNTLAAQINAEVIIKNKNGTAYEFHFN